MGQPGAGLGPSERRISHDESGYCLGLLTFNVPRPASNYVSARN